MNISFYGKNWTPLKVILLIFVILLMILFIYYSLYSTRHIIPVESHYTNKIYSLLTAEHRDRYRVISIPLTKLPYTISYWINLRMDASSSPGTNNRELAPQLLLYVGDQEGTYSIINQSVEYDETLGGYQMLYESFMNNKYYSNVYNKANSNRYFRANEWVQYTFAFKEKSINVYVNGKLQQIILYERTWQQIANPCFAYFFIPPYMPLHNLYNFPPKQLYSFKWYNTIVRDGEIEEIYEKERKELEVLLEEKQQDQVDFCNN